MIAPRFYCTYGLAFTAAAFFSLALSGPVQATSTTSATTSAPRLNDVRAAAPSVPASGQLTQELRYRVSSPQVRELQVRLRSAKYLALYDVDDRFGMVTREAVVKFQRDSGLKPTGTVNPQTWSALLARTRAPTEAELNNTDIGSWFVAPDQTGYMMELQHRLRQVGLYQGALDGSFNTPTRRAIEAWRERIGLPASEVMDERTWTPLIRRTRTPRYADLFNAQPTSTLVQELDPRCATGKVVCVSKNQRKMSYVVDGKVRFTREARFSGPGWDSPEGEFRIWYMNSDTVSKIFGERTPMPYAIFYDGNVAIHYSQDFADKGYEGGSHGCTQLRDYQVAKWLYEQLKVGDKVVVY